MREVSCRAVDPFFQTAKQRGIPGEAFADGVGYSLTHLRDRHERIDWDAFCRFMANVRRHFDTDALVEIGADGLKSTGFRSFALIGRTLMSPSGFYRWMLTSGGMGNQLFSNMSPMYRELGAGQIDLDLQLSPGYPVCEEFFYFASGGFKGIPVLLGLARAEVTMTWIERGARFHIRFEEKQSRRARLVRRLTRRTDARATANELNDTIRELERYQANLEKLVEERTHELRIARDELADTVGQLREAQNARERFFGNISHEIRTPLSLILLAAADIDRRAAAQLDGRSRANLGAIGDATRKLVRLVDELLLLAAGREDKLRIHPEPTDLAALITQLAAAWRPAAEQAGLQLVVSTPASAVARVDPVAIERVASNLISNAVKYTPSGGTLELAITCDGTDVQLSVLDTGHGIPEDLAGRLFGRFERATGDDRRKLGTGLGLWLVKQLVEAHGGTVSALARPGGGSELRVWLPNAVTTDSPGATALRVGVAESLPGIASGTRIAPADTSVGTILVADDDAPLAEMIARLLGERYTVFVALDGTHAEELVRKHQPQLLITDVDMPGQNGIELARAFRAASGDSLAPIIILSAVSDLGTRVQGLQAGAVDYVLKPFEPIELIARVDAQFRMRDLALRLHRAERLSFLGIVTGGLAHELRNPSNGIVNAIGPLVQLLPKELTQPKMPVRALLDVLGSCAEQVGFLSRQLLGFRSDRDLELRAARLSEIVDRALGLAGGALNGVEVRKHLGRIDDIACAPPLLVQVMTNLVENAAQAAGAGGWIDIHTGGDAERASIEVLDSGPGVPVELRERIFEPFYTTKAPGTGTGLGLAIAREIAHRHEGVLEIREREGRCAFVVEIPRRVDGCAGSPTPPSA